MCAIECWTTLAQITHTIRVVVVDTIHKARLHGGGQVGVFRFGQHARRGTFQTFLMKIGQFYVWKNTSKTVENHIKKTTNTFPWISQSTPKHSHAIPNQPQHDRRPPISTCRSAATSFCKRMISSILALSSWLRNTGFWSFFLKWKKWLKKVKKMSSFNWKMMLILKWKKKTINFMMVIVKWKKWVVLIEKWC